MRQHFTKNNISNERRLYYPTKNNQLKKINICKNIIVDKVDKVDNRLSEESFPYRWYEESFPPLKAWKHIELIFLNGDTSYMPIGDNYYYGFHRVLFDIEDYLIINCGFRTVHDFKVDFTGYNNNNPTYIVCDNRHIDSCSFCNHRCNNIFDHVDEKYYNYFKNYPKVDSNSNNGNCSIEYVLRNLSLAKLIQLYNNINIDFTYPFNGVFTNTNIMNNKPINYRFCGSCLRNIIEECISLNGSYLIAD